MKKLITIILAAVMILASAAPAMAEDVMKADLTSVTEHVVTVLDVGDDYTDFSGEYYDNIPPTWYLYWSKDGEDLSVNCAEDGTITSVYWGRYADVNDRFYGYDAAFSSLPLDEARSQAEEWLVRLASEGETCRIDNVNEPRTSRAAYEFSGIILYHGLETPVHFTLTLNADGLNNYYRSTALCAYKGEMPGETPEVNETDAASKLYDSITMELFYVKDGDEVRLRYVPVTSNYIVDAVTGDTVDMIRKYEEFGGRGMYADAGYGGYMVEESAAAEDKATGRALTEVEIQSIDKYTDVLKEEDLDAAIRSIEGLGLTGFNLDRCSYSMDSEGNIRANVRYSCNITEENLFGFSKESYQEMTAWGEKPMAFKYVTVDAGTSKLIEVSTSFTMWDMARKNVTDPEAANGFLKAAAADMVENCDICTLSGYNQETGITFARVHDGYFFPENYLYVEINPVTKAVERFYYTWDDDAAFAPSEDLISEDEARKIYADALTVTLGLTAWPEAIDYDDPVLYRYAEWGYSYIESLKLAYYYSDTEKYAGVDALTGEIVNNINESHLEYDDLEGVPQKDEIERLAQAGIGFAGGSFKPDAALAMRDAAVLLAQSSGGVFIDVDDDELKSMMASQGFITYDEWDPDKELAQRKFHAPDIG